jgi:hypothetical protein
MESSRKGGIICGRPQFKKVKVTPLGGVIPRSHKATRDLMPYFAGVYA